MNNVLFAIERMRKRSERKEKELLDLENDEMHQKKTQIGMGVISNF